MFTRTQSLHSRILAVAVISAIAGVASHANAAVVFNDTFDAGSTINASPVAPTATATSYEVASTKNDSGSNASTIASANLALKQVATTSGVTEIQALFTATPVTLATAGDTVDLRMTFTPNNLATSAFADTLYFGLYNSGSPASLPLNTLQNAGLSTATTSPTGGAAGWLGYVSQISPASTTSTGKVVTRPVQTGATNANQDLVANGASGGTYTGGATLSPNFINPLAAGLTAQAYTEDLTITLNGDGSQTINTNLYQGTDITGTNVVSQSVNTLTPVVGSFDALAFGFRHSGTSVASVMNVSALSVTSSVAGGATPEPASLGILAIGGLSLLTRRRKA
jgi:hypothetical protein